MLRLSPNFSRNVDWNLLKTFHEIAEAGGVSRAGRALRRKQPALSLALKRLEAELGVTLCRRGPRGFELTDEGMLVAETCRSLNSLVRNVPKRLGNLTEEIRGRISIQVISSLVCERFDAAISRFHDRHPKVEILIDITTWDSVAAALLRDEIDIQALREAARLIVEANWRRQMIGGIGEVFTPFAQLRGDIYGVNGLEKGLDGSEDFVDDEKEGSDAILRGVALGGIEYRYPFIASTGNITHVVEPIGQIIAHLSS